MAKYVTKAQLISTHAPAGGATNRGCTARRTRYISTHAPAGGATLAERLGYEPEESFLLTPLREGRQEGKQEERKEA